MNKFGKKNNLNFPKKLFQKGFSLIELILVLGISSIAFLGFLSMEKYKVEIQNSENAGSQFLETGQALASYIAKENTYLKANIPVGTEALFPLGALTNPGGSTTLGPMTYPNHQYLPNTYNDTTLLNTKMVMAVKNNAGNIITGLVISNGPILDTSGAIRYDFIGSAIKKMGPQGGMTFGVPNTLSGLAGAWSLNNTDFTEINALGLLGYRVQYQSDYDASYLRLDGQYPMIGNLNMGNYSIKNATDISYNGWIYGNNAVFNNIITGNITNSGNIQTNSINGKTTPSVTTAVTNAGNKNYANFDLLYSNCLNCGMYGEGPAAAPNSPGDVRIGSTGNQGNLYVKDVILGTNAARGDMSNTDLSDHLSRYVDRGIVLMNDGDNLVKPVINPIAVGATGISGYACNYFIGKTPPVAKIELVPQSAFVQSRVMGPIGITATPAGGGYSNLNIYQDQVAVGGFEVYAIDLGASWIARITTANYPTSNGVTGGKALAHIYCDYGV